MQLLTGNLKNIYSFHIPAKHTHYTTLFTLPEHLSSPPIFSGVRVTRSLVLYVCFVDRCLSFCTFSFGHCVTHLFFEIRILIVPLVSSNSFLWLSVPHFSKYIFLLPLPIHVLIPSFKNHDFFRFTWTFFNFHPCAWPFIWRHAIFLALDANDLFSFTVSLRNSRKDCFILEYFLMSTCHEWLLVFNCINFWLEIWLGNIVQFGNYSLCKMFPWRNDKSRFDSIY